MIAASARSVVAQRISASRGHTHRANALERTVNYGLEFVGVFHFAALGEDNAGFVGVEPSGIAVVFFGLTRVPDFHQECFDYIFLHTPGLPEDPLGVNVDVEMAGLDDADSSRFFSGLAFGGLTMRKAGLRCTFRKRPLAAAIGMNKKKFDTRIHPPIAHSGDLKR